MSAAEGSASSLLNGGESRMRLKWLWWIVLIAVGGSLLGAHQVTGYVVLSMGLVGLLVYAVSGGRPNRDGRGLGTRSPSFLGRFRGPDPGDLPGLALTALAGSTLLGALDGASRPGLVLAAGLGVMVGFLPSVSAVVLGVGGTIATIVSTFMDPMCAVPPTRSLMIQFMAIGIVGVLAFALVSGGRLGLRPPLRRNITFGGWALIAFGLTDLVLFAAAPEGLAIWDEAPTWTRMTSVALVAVIAGAAAWAPALVLGLVALGVLGATVALAAANVGAWGMSQSCGSPGQALLLGVVMGAVAAPIRGFVRAKT